MDYGNIKLSSKNNKIWFNAALLKINQMHSLRLDNQNSYEQSSILQLM